MTRECADSLPGIGRRTTKDLSYIHATNQYQDFAAKLRYMYSSVGDNFDHAVSYSWVTYLFTGMTPDEVQKLATASHTYWATMAAMQRKLGLLPSNSRVSLVSCRLAS